MTKKTKTIDVGVVKTGKYGKYISFDSSIKEIQFTKEVEIDGEKVVQVLKVERNEEGYLAAMNIELPAKRVEFRLDKGWMNQEQADKMLANAEKYGISSYLTVKVN